MRVCRLPRDQEQRPSGANPRVTAPGGNYARYTNRAIPGMKSEILAAQSTNVAAVSGATYTSQAYAQSVQSALDKA